MRKLLLMIPAFAVLVAVGAFVAQPTGTAQADNGIHEEGWGATPDGCAACHRVHRGVDEYLLLDEVETLCFQCHGTGALGSDLDVQAGTNVDDDGALRSGGFVTARIRTDDPSLPIPVFPEGLGHGAAANAARDVPGTSCLPDGVDDDGDTVIDDGCSGMIRTLAVGAGQTTQSKHSTDGSPQTVWGNGAIDGSSNPGLTNYELTCASCHDPHGNGNYRILKDEPDGSGGAGYAIPDTYLPRVYTTTNYFDMSYSGDYAADNLLIDTSAWCMQCHTRYWAAGRAPAGASETSRVDSGDPIFTYRHTSSGVSWNSTTGTAESGPQCGNGIDDDGDTRADDGCPVNKNRACITCHASHGSNATAGFYSGSVPLPDGTAGAGSADSRLLKMNNRGICQKCHNK